MYTYTSHTYILSIYRPISATRLSQVGEEFITILHEYCDHPALSLTALSAQAEGLVVAEQLLNVQ